jgi:tetratricopeptide (TPR) repeat protein
MKYSKDSRAPGGLPEIKMVVSPSLGTNGRVPKGAWPRNTEAGFMHMDQLSPKEGFESIEAAQAFYEKYMPPGKKPKFPKPKEPWHQAQEIAYSGWEKKSARGRAAAAQKALKISPDAPDGYLLLAHDASAWEEALVLAEKAVAAAMRLLGDDPFERFPEFWGPAITRPYMRARYAVGYALWKQGKVADARQEFQELLRLNPKDNQGARYLLVALLLEMGEYGQAQQVISRFSPDNLSHWAYNKVLLHFRRRGDDPAARDLGRQALRANPFVPGLLLGQMPITSWELEFIAAGEIDEAIEYVHLYKQAWLMVAGALEWLRRWIS